MLEALYRHLSSDDVRFEALLRQHLTRSADRVSRQQEAYAIHDTTVCVFGGEREGLGVVSGQKQNGFLAHLSLAVSSDGTKTPLGLLAHELWSRGPKRTAAGKESARWQRGFEAASKAAGIAGKLIHVADRESDIYPLMVAMMHRGERFIIRAKSDRAVDVEGEGKTYLFAAARETRQTYEVEVPLSPRNAGFNRTLGQRRTYPGRPARTARLSVAALRLSIRRSGKCTAELPARLDVNVVHVFELSPPTGQRPVEWLLLTSEPIATREQITRVVDGYRTRWVIEDYFKAVKTGCAYETRQLESFRTLTNLLAYTLVIAYALLLVRVLARNDTGLGADALLSDDQLTCLRLMCKHKLPKRPTAQQVLLEIAQLGVHLRSNGDPGWQVLSRGWKRVLECERAYQAMKKGWTCDQSLALSVVRRPSPGGRGAAGGGTRSA